MKPMLEKYFIEKATFVFVCKKTLIISVENKLASFVILLPGIGP